jgi:beta-lactamase superfamily II metal-dependent hydrolase
MGGQYSFLELPALQIPLPRLWLCGDHGKFCHIAHIDKERPMKKMSVVVALLLTSPFLFAEVKVHILDTGPGLATVIELPDEHYVLYDTGHWYEIDETLASVQDILPEDAAIDMIILSHTDSDHIAATDEILKHYFVGQVIRTGLPRSSVTWKRVDKAIRDAASAGDIVDVNLADYELLPGSSYLYGDAMLTFLAGFHTPPAEWDIKGTSEYNNAGSIVVRIVYKGKSILLMGDAVGRHIDDPDDQLIATEKFLVDNAHSLVIDSDVLIASHHGADNGSATAFIEAVSPEWVIFSAGHDYEHPRATTAQRFLDYGVSLNKILRTDLGDDEDDPKEWAHGRINGHTDSAGDDEIEIIISDSGELSVVQ